MDVSRFSCPMQWQVPCPHRLGRNVSISQIVGTHARQMDFFTPSASFSPSVIDMTWNRLVFQSFPGGTPLAMATAGMAFLFADAPQRVYWELTRACDLSCTHCRAQSRPPTEELTTAEICATLDALAQGRRRTSFSPAAIR